MALSRTIVSRHGYLSLMGNTARPDPYPLNRAALRLSLPSFYLLLYTFLSCSSPTPPPPPPPPFSPDTTSHEFIWEIDTLGDGNSSVLYDVAIINDSTIWAVGKIYLKDSAGNLDPTVYGLARWNGIQWNDEHIPYHDYGTTVMYPGPLLSIFAFSAADIFVCSYANLLHWNGFAWQEKAFFMTAIPFNNQVQKMWGSSGSNLYCVGRTGGKYHFNGTSWKKIESGTTVDLVDVWGTGEDNVWVSGYDRQNYLSSALLHGVNGVFETRYNFVAPYSGESLDSLTGLVTAVWTDDALAVVVLDGANVWNLPLDTRGEGTIAWKRTQQGGFLTKIRGSKGNNVFVTGDFGEIGHYNGSTWRWYKPFFSFSGDLLIHGLACTDNLVVAVGSSNGKGVVICGRRQ